MPGSTSGRALLSARTRAFCFPHPIPKPRAQASEAAMAEVARLEAIFSLFDENSELMRLNRDKILPNLRRICAS